ncbi:MAG: SIS domain-containing protein [Candidatus Eisenbacteria bacterium]|uniref:SIS domain-containing protein n=1 Tax=Eiseniibacteriota bacterium TaxID=2212470 RepID=A0A538TBY2_UNCEI|nr:MAG: SIS domain-containing protein [Candidatus Eisenbacteria bacterium]
MTWAGVPCGRARPRERIQTRAYRVSPRRARAVRVSPVTRSIRRVFAESAATLLAVFAREIDSLERMSRLLVSTLARRRTVFFCGNGGSAAEAQHLATELVVRFVRNRGALPAMALGADGSMLTAAGNDLGFDRRRCGPPARAACR